MTRPRLGKLLPRVRTVELRSVGTLPDGRNIDARRVYESRRWRERVRPAKLARDPLCQACKHQGLVVEAAHVDHRMPIAQGGDKWSEDNLVSLCASCHSRKTMCERTGEPFPEIAPNTSRGPVIA